MLSSRDFSKSNKEYIRKNKFPILILCLVLVAGLICALAFGFNGNFEVKGYNEFSVLVGNASTKTLNNYQSEFSSIINERGGKYDSAYILGEGDNTKLVIRYSSTISSEKQEEVNAEIAKKLGIEEGQISEYISAHVEVSPVVKSRDYLYTAVTILVILVLATLFAYFRYDGACAISTILACVLGSWLFMSFGSILRLTIGSSYLAMLVIINLLIIYCSFLIFENIRETSWLQSKEYATALNTAIKTTRTRMLLISFGLLVIGLLFAVIAPNNIKLVSINILFMAVTLLAIIWYVLPFCWSVLITRANIRRFKTKTKKSEDTVNKIEK